MDDAISPFASTGWALLIGTWVFKPVWFVGLVLGLWAVLKGGRPRMGSALVVAAILNPLLAGLLWVSVNWAGYGGGAEGSLASNLVDTFVIASFIGAIVVIGWGTLFFFVRFLKSFGGRATA